MPQNNVIANDLFARVGDILAGTPHANRVMHDIFVQVCEQGLKDNKQAFGNLFSQVAYLCKRHNVSAGNMIAIQNARRNSNHTQTLTAEDLAYCCRALCVFISAVFNISVPSWLVGKIPHINNLALTRHHIDYKYIRCIVKLFDDKTITVEVDQNINTHTMFVDCSAEDLRYLTGILREGMQLNLLDCELNKDNMLIPRRVIIEPDFLVDISSIARCFTDHGHNPLAYIVNRIAPSTNSQAILLGNFAGKALDDVVNKGNGEYKWTRTFTNNFKAKALEYATCDNLDNRTYKVAAYTQACNIEQIVEYLFRNSDEFCKRKALLEPSFVCERLGLLGRVDLMTTDFKLLVEQKSGNNYNIARNFPNRYGSFQAEAHYVQLLLYYGVLRYNFNLGNSKINAYLLYSKYALPGGLVSVTFFAGLFNEAIRFRNRLVANEFNVALNGFDSVIDRITLDALNENNDKSRLFLRYIAPQLSDIINPLHNMQPLERAYYCRMMTFVYNEQLAGKVGAIEGVGSSGADLWNMPLSEKRETGNIYTCLRVINKERSDDFSGYDTITLAVPKQGEDFLPNFRRGDMVYLYEYDKNKEPDVRASILYKGVLTQLCSDTITVHLNDSQQNPDILSPDNSYRAYAIEHGDNGIGTGSAIRGLHTFITSVSERKSLLLSQRVPEFQDEDIKLSRSYNKDYDDILLCAKQAKDYFLLIGPPGTGKTSMALRYIVEEELASPPSLSCGEGAANTSMSNTLFKGEGADNRRTSNPDVYSILRSNANINRKEHTDAEYILWQALRNNQTGYKIRRQHPINDFIVDFISIERHIIIEVDGEYHDSKEQKEADDTHTGILNQLGFKVIRFKNDEVINNLTQVLASIKTQLAAPSPQERAGGEAILLMAYTNRAVDEICTMLADSEIDFIRIGNTYTCDERFRDYMISNTIGTCPQLFSIRRMIADARVVVSTTSSMMSNLNIFNIKRFSLAVIDEASQILEPNIVGLLAAKHNGKLAISKFILIGDYKQLPAVVRQNEATSHTDDPLLREIGLTDCRVSLFERLILWERSQHRTRFIGTLRKQGRMHPDVAEFSANMFYKGERLEIVPLKHQQECALNYKLQSQDAFDDMLKAHRMIFIPSEFCRKPNISDKTNVSEARIAADVLRRIHRFYGDKFNAGKTVGVIVPYRNQIAMIRKEIEKLGIKALSQVSIDTVERYQGSQRDVIIYSFTVQNRYQLEFLTSNCFEENGQIIDRKLNVALTRARLQMIITGNEAVLSNNLIFTRLMRFVKQKGGWIASC